MGFLTDSGVEHLWTHIVSLVGNKVDRVSGKGLSTNDYTTTEKEKLAGIETGAQVNTVTGVKGNSESSYRTGNINITKANIGLGNVDNTADSAKNVAHAVSADSATSATSATKATQDGSGNVITSTYETKTDSQTKLDEAKAYTDIKTSGLATSISVDTKISTHNTSTDSHNDIRDLITGLTTRLNTLANSDDITLDQMSEVVAYIKNNKSLIDGITTSKVNVADIIDNLTTNVANKPLSAAQGVVIKNLIDALQTEVDEKVSASRTINNKALTENITLSASDVGAYSKDEIDNLELITVEDIDTICQGSIVHANEVEF